MNTNIMTYKKIKQMKTTKKPKPQKLIISSKFIQLPHISTHNKSQVLNKYSSLQDNNDDNENDDDQLDKYLFSNQQILMNLKKIDQGNRGRQRKVTAYVAKNRKLEKIRYDTEMFDNGMNGSQVVVKPNVQKKNRIKTVIEQARKLQQIQPVIQEQKVLQFRYHPNSLFNKISSLRQHKSQFTN